MAKLTDDKVREIRTKAEAGVRQADLVREYGFSSGVISRLVNRKSWAHVE